MYYLNMENYINRRQEICNHCPIHLEKDNICDAYSYLNPKTMEKSNKPKKGFIKGCGCALSFKIKNINSKCIAGLW